LENVAMTGAICALLIFWFQAPEHDADPGRLVTLLGSTKYADRQAAADALERLGRAALPVLRVARDSKDLEVRTRAVSLLRKIEGAMLTQPTMLKLDFKDALLSDVIQSLSKQSGFKISIFPDTLVRLKTQKVTLQAVEPVSFWRGIDLLCDISQLRPNPGMISATSGREPTFALVAGNPAPVLPSSDHGPFRINLSQLRSERNVTFGVAAPGRPSPLPGRPAIGGEVADTSGSTSKPVPILNVQFNFQLQVVAEPHLSMTQSGHVQLLEAVDDVGNSLAQAANEAHAHRLISSRVTRHIGGMSGQQLQLVVPLKRPEAPGKTIKVLKGVVPLLVASRRPGPLVVPIADAAGKTFENSEMQVVIHGIRKNPTQTQTTIELTIRPLGDAAPIFEAEPNASRDSFLPQSDVPQQHIDVLDAQGRVLPWYQTSNDPDSSRMAMTLNQFGAGIEPKEIRFYSLTKAVTSVPFEFRDLPLP
jgi:hypothetical protein